MLCGYLPFEDENTNILYKKILKGSFELPSFLSRAGKDMINKILDTNPETRFTLTDIRLHPWFALVKPRGDDLNDGIVVGNDSIPVSHFSYPRLTLMCLDKWQNTI